MFPNLAIKDEEIELATNVDHSLVKVAQPVIAQEIAETGMALVYPRKIPLGNFRKVCLWLPHEIGMPEFLAACHAVEEVELEDKKKAFICRFLFFGVRDSTLKQIRRWIKEYTSPLRRKRVSPLTRTHYASYDSILQNIARPI